MKRQLALIPAVLLLIGTLTSCSSDEPSAKDSDMDCVVSGSASESVTVEGDFGESLELTSDTPITVKESERTVLIEGKGEEIDPEQDVFLVLNVFNGNDGSLVEHNRAPLNNSEGYAAWVAETLNCAKIGDRVALVVPSQTVFGAENAAEDESLIIVSDVEGPALEQAEGKDVALPEGTPEVKIAEDGEPTITIPKGLDAPKKLEVHTMVEGEGAVIEAGDEVFVHYKGIIWRTGEDFDSSWSRGAYINFNAADSSEAAELGVGGVIGGFRDALVGQTVGSRVMSIVPAEDGGYGGDGLVEQGHKADDVMVFVLDILEMNPLKPAAE